MNAPRQDPPKFARGLLRLLSPRDRGTIDGDLAEEYRRFVLPKEGRAAADRWYWRQVLGSVPSLLKRRLGLEAVVRDVRHAMKVLVRRPAPSVAVVATLALALAANTAVFTVVHSTVLKPLPYQNVDRLMRPMPNSLFWLDAGQAAELERRLTTVESLNAWGRSLFFFDQDGEAEEVRGAAVEWNHFQSLGAPALHGRVFVEDDAVAGDAIILSHGLWERRFGADPAVIGSTLSMFGSTVRVVGVMGPDHVPMEYDWEAWSVRTFDVDYGGAMAAVVLRRPGVSESEVEAEVRETLLAIWSEGGYEASAEERAEMISVPISEWLLGDARTSLLLVLGAVGLILLLACLNVSTLLLAQMGRRSQELGVRAALGGGAGAVARQLGAELVLLGLVAGVLGLFGGWLLLDAFAGMLPDDLPRVHSLALSGEVVWYAVAATLAGSILAGLFPLVRTIRSGASLDGLLTGVRSVTSGRGRGRARALLVAAQVMFSITLVVGAGLMLRSYAALTSVDPGFRPEGLVTVRPSPPSSRYEGQAELNEYYARIVEEVGALPGVLSVGQIQFLPMTSGGWWSSYRPEGVAYSEGRNRPRAAVRLIDEGYLDTVEQSLLDGIGITALDAQGEEYGVLINETLASAAFPQGDAVGRLLMLGGDESAVARVKGVVADVRQVDLRTPPHPEMYFHKDFEAWRRFHIVARVSGDPVGLLGPVAAAVRRVDPGVHLLGPRTVHDVIRRTYSQTQLLTALLGLFGVVAMAIGAIGVYGVASQSVSERTREFGIRLALGAERGGVAGSAVRVGMRPVALGLAVGLVVALTGARLIESQLFGVDARDPAVFVLGPVALVLVAFLATALPATRAARLDPVETLRTE